MSALSKAPHMRSRSIAVALCLAAAACNSKQGLPETPKEVVRLGQLVGKWKSTSHHLANNLHGTASDAEFKFECKWTLDKYYVACTQVGEIGGQPMKEADVFGYSDQAKMYTMMVVIDIGQSAPQVYTNFFSWDGNTWHFLPKDGGRATWEIVTPDLHKTQTEHSVDGVHWEVSATGEHTRL